MRRTSAVICCLFFLSFSGDAQAKKVSGKVLQSDGTPVMGALVYAEISDGIVRSESDNGGYYSIELPDNKDVRMMAVCIPRTETKDVDRGRYYFLVDNWMEIKYKGESELNLIFKASGSIRLKGKIVYISNYTGRSIVMIVAKDKSFGKSVLSETDGSFLITGLPSGEYDIQYIRDDGGTGGGVVVLSEKEETVIFEEDI